MKALFDTTSLKITRLITRQYSTSFSVGIYMLGRDMQPKIYTIYGFVRLADEILDSFMAYDREQLLNRFVADYRQSLKDKISVNPVLNAFQKVAHDYELYDLVEDFLKSMAMDLKRANYENIKDYNTYIHGSADVVGLMCLKVFVRGNHSQYNTLKPYAIKLGSAFQKVNFLRDFTVDYKILGRSYFPNIQFDNFTEAAKSEIITDIENDFEEALIGIKKLPLGSRLGVFIAYKYYLNLLKKLKRKSPKYIQKHRVSVPSLVKLYILFKAYLRYKVNWI